MALPRKKTLNELVIESVKDYKKTINKNPSKIGFFEHMFQKANGHGQTGRDNATFIKRFAERYTEEDVVRSIYLITCEKQDIGNTMATRLRDILFNYLNINTKDFEEAKSTVYRTYAKQMSTISAGVPITEEMMKKEAQIIVIKKSLQAKGLIKEAALQAVTAKMEEIKEKSKDQKMVQQTMESHQERAERSGFGNL